MRGGGGGTSAKWEPVGGCFIYELPGIKNGIPLGAVFGARFVLRAKREDLIL